MPGDAVAEVKARVDIVDVIAGYVQLQRGGREFKGLCPFHAEKTPSFTVNRERQVWYCHGCGEGGDVLSFVERIERIDFPQALALLAERAGVELDRGRPGSGRNSGRRRARILELNARAQAYYEHVLWATDAGAPGRQLLQERGVDRAEAGRFGVGFAPAGGESGDALGRYLIGRRGASAEELVDAGLAHHGRGSRPRDRFRHRLLFPIRDERGAVLGFGGRALGDAVPKYLNTPETAVYHKSSALFGIDLARAALTRERTAVVVEGYFDVIAAHRAGVDNVVASSGTSLTREQVRLLARTADSITLCLDADAAGRTATSRAVGVIAREGLASRICLLPGGAKDPDEAVREDPAAFARAVAEARAEWQVLLDGALGDAEGGTVEARRAAADRVVALLLRIPEATARDLYVQQAARRLDIREQSLAADLARARRDRSPQRSAVVMSPPVAPAPAVADDEPDPGAGIAMPAWERHLGSILVHRPSTAHALNGMGLAVTELVHPTVQNIMRIALDVDNGAEFPLHRLTAHDQRRAAGLLIADVPELDDDADAEVLERALHDCVARVREDGIRRSLARIHKELQRAKDDGRDADVQLLAARVTELAVASHRLRGAARAPGG